MLNLSSAANPWRWVITPRICIQGEYDSYLLAFKYCNKEKSHQLASDNNIARISFCLYEHTMCRWRTVVGSSTAYTHIIDCQTLSTREELKVGLVAIAEGRSAGASLEELRMEHRKRHDAEVAKDAEENERCATFFSNTHDAHKRSANHVTSNFGYHIARSGDSEKTIQVTSNICIGIDLSLPPSLSLWMTTTGVCPQRKKPVF